MNSLFRDGPLVGPRSQFPANIARGLERTHIVPWHTNRVVWPTFFGATHSIGHFWDDTGGVFRGYYINLQEPLRRSVIGFDSIDHVLEIVVELGGAWRWKDEDELAEAIQFGIFSQLEAATIRAEGERAIASLPKHLPTRWEDWKPEPAWPLLTLPANVDC
jgi:predicted RNA-binding protein associated with RNAse of E/G family